MKCQNCNNEIKNNSNFCPNCGASLVVNGETQQIKKENNKKGPLWSVFSVFSLVFLILSILVHIPFSSVLMEKGLYNFFAAGFSLIHLVLVIIGKVKCNDKLSRTILWIYIVLLVLLMITSFVITIFSIVFVIDIIRNC